MKKLLRFWAYLCQSLNPFNPLNRNYRFVDKVVWLYVGDMGPLEGLVLQFSDGYELQIRIRDQEGCYVGWPLDMEAYIPDMTKHLTACRIDTIRYYYGNASSTKDLELFIRPYHHGYLHLGFKGKGDRFEFKIAQRHQ